MEPKCPTSDFSKLPSSQHFLILTHDPASSFAIITNKMKTIAMPCIMLPLFGNLVLHHKNELMISFPFFSTFISCKPVIVTSPLERSLMGISTTISDGETMVTIRQEQKLNQILNTILSKRTYYFSQHLLFTIDIFWSLFNSKHKITCIK